MLTLRNNFYHENHAVPKIHHSVRAGQLGTLSENDCRFVGTNEILTSFQLMIVYLLVFVGIIDHSVIKNTDEQIASVIRGFRIKIESLSVKYGLNEISDLVISFTKFVKNSVNYSEGDGRIELDSKPNFDVCDKF